MRSPVLVPYSVSRFNPARWRHVLRSAGYPGSPRQIQSYGTAEKTEKNAGLSIRHYVLWKLVHASLSFVLFILLLRRMPPV